MQRQRNGAAAKLHTPCRGGPSPPEADATERPVEWYSPKSTEFLASPGGKLDFLTSGASEPIGKKA